VEHNRERERKREKERESLDKHFNELKLKKRIYLEAH
jgi:hypothetical protein